MHSIRFATIPGVTADTNIKQLFKVARQFPLGELSTVLADGYSSKDFAWTKKFGELAQDSQTASMLELGHENSISLIKGDSKLNELASEFGRVRLNLHTKENKIEVAPVDISKFAHLFSYGYGHGKILIPYSKENDLLCKSLQGSSAIEISIPAQFLLGDEVLRDKFFGQRIGFTGLPSLAGRQLEQDLSLIHSSIKGKPYWLEVNPNEIKSSSNGYDIKKVEECLQNISIKVMSASIEAGEKLIKEIPSATHAEDLDGYWVNWWAAAASGYRLAVPEENAVRPMYMHRRDGTFHGIEPLEYASDAKDILDHSEIGCVKKDGVWNGVTSKGEMIPGDSRELAMLRALVVDSFGHDLPANPATHPKFQQEWVGKKVVDTCLPDLIVEAHSTRGLRR